MSNRTDKERDQQFEKLVKVATILLVIGATVIQLLFTWTFQSFIPTDWPDSYWRLHLILLCFWCGGIGLLSVILAMNIYSE